MYQVLTPNSPPIGQRLTNKARSIVLAALLLCTALGAKAQGGITVSVNGGEQLTKNTLQEVVTTSGVTPTDVIRLEVVDGDLAQTDAQYMVDELINLEMLTLTSAKQFNVVLQHHPSLRELKAPLLESIADNAFYGCDSLTSVSLPVATSIGAQAFYYCYALASVSLPVATSIGAQAFYNCDALTSVSLPVATSIGEGAFNNCNALASVSLPVATSIGRWAFSDCYALASVSLPVATSIGEGAFSYCHALTSVSLPVATNIGEGAFNNCHALTSVSLPAATSIESYAFIECYALSTISLPVATSIGINAFNYCNSLSSVSLPAATSIGINAFNYCNSLSSVSLPAATSIGEGAFYNCESLTNVSLPVATSIDSWAFNECYALSNISVPVATSIGEGAFSYCYALTNISLPAATSIGPKAFQYCKLLTFLELGATTPPTLENNTFNGCPSLRYLQVNDANAYKNDNDGDTNDNLWHGWLLNVQPAPLTVKVNGGAEHTASSLHEAIAASGVILSKVTQLEVLSGDLLASDAVYMVNTLTKLEKLSLTSAVELNLQIQGHPSLKELNAPMLESIGNNAFSDCYSLTSVNLPAANSIGERAFNNCNALSSVSLPNTTNIGNYAFANCNALTSVNLPAANSIGSWTFQGCNLLTFIELGAIPPTLGNNTFNGCPNLRFLQVSDADAYISDDNDGNTNDNLWHGWLINEQPAPLTVKVNGGAESSASSLHEAITDSGVDPANVAQLEVLSGDLLASDAAYMVNMLTKLEKLTLTSAKQFNVELQYHPSLRELYAPMLESIGNNAFYGCDSLASMSLPAATSIGKRAFSYCGALTSVNLPVATSIGERTFYNCHNLTSVSLPAATSIGRWAFCDCYSLASVNLPAATIIGESAFNNCNALSSVSLPNATNIGNYAFAYCDALTSVSLPNVTNIGEWAFENCSAFTFIELGTPPPTVDYSSFNGCPSRRYLQVNDADAYKNDNDGYTNDNLWHGWLINVQPAPLTVKVNGGAEHTGSSLHVAIADSGVDPANVAQLEVLNGDLLASDAVYMVNTLTKLEKLTLTSAVAFNLQIQRHPSLKELHAPMLESIGNNAFYDCDSLASVSLPAATSIGERTFYNCHNLTSVSLPAATSIGESAFEYCHNLTNVNLPVATSIGNWAFNNCNALSSVSLPNATNIGSWAFYNCDSLVSVNLPAATIVGDGAFAYCYALTSVSLPNATNIGESAFAYCDALTSVSLPNVTNIGSWTFENCSAFTFLELGTTPPILGYSSFNGCPSQRYLQVNDADAYKNDNDGDTNDNLWHGWLINVQPTPLTVRVNGGAEHTGSSLHEAIADSGVDPANVAQLEVLNGDLLASDAVYMVNTLTKLEKLTLTSAVEFNLQIQRHPSLKELHAPMLESMGDYAFYDCDSLTSVSLPAATSIGERAFNNCNALTNVSLPNTTNIGNYAFANCNALTSMNLPAANSIGSWTFQGCNLLTFIELGAIPPTLGNNAFNGCPSQRYLQVNDADAYKNDNDGDTNDNLWHGWLINEQPAPLTVRVNGGAESSASSLHEAITDSGVDPANVAQLEVLSGDLLASDAVYMVNTLTKLEKLTLTSAVAFNLQIQRHPSLKELHAPMLESIGNNAFYDCDSLASVSLPAATSIGERAFSYCGALTSVNLPVATSIGERTFYNCHNLTSVSLPAATSIGRWAFSDCYSLASVNLPAATIIGESAFNNCNALSSVSLPNATNIGNYAFAYCDALTSVSLPNVTNIGEWAFNYCKQLIFFNLRATPPTLKNKYVFDGCPNPRYLMLVDAEGNLLTGNELATAQNAYRANAGWSTIMQTWHGWTLSEGFLIRALPAEGGTVIGAGNYAKGSDVSLTAIPNTGYSFVMWSENGTQVSTDTTYAFECTANRTLTAEFEKILAIYKLRYTAGEGGSISGTTTQEVKEGESGTEVEAVPNAGYRFVKWSDGLTTSKRTDTNVQSDISVTAEFEKDSTDEGGNNEGGNNTGLFDISRESLSVYPNPTTGELWVTMPELAEGIAAEVHVYNANGQLLQRVPARAASTGSAASRVNINLSGYPSGMYIIRVGNAIAKVVKH